MSVPRVSVCIRTVDRPREVRAAVASVLAQDFADLEVIVSSDGPADDDLVAAYRDPRLRVCVNAGPPGPTGNLLHAFGQARGELLALLDDDDEWRPGFLAAMVAAFDADDRLGVAFCDYELVAGSVTVERRWPWPTGEQDDIAVRLLDRSIPPAAAVMRRAAWLAGERDLPLRPDMAGAASLWLRAAAQGWRFRHVDRTLVRYALHAEQMSWSGDATSARYAETLSALSFAAPSAERARRARLAEAHLTQAGIRLRRGDLAGGRVELRRARASGAGPSVRGVLAMTGIRRAAARRLATHPRVLAAALPVWQRIRPRVD